MISRVKIEPLNIEGFSADDNADMSSRVVSILKSWDRTPYMINHQKKQVAVDCVRFVSGVLDELHGDFVDPAHLPLDTCFHQKDLCYSALKTFIQARDSVKVEGAVVQPGDVLVAGPVNGGPGHALIAGERYLWHCDTTGVCKTGLALRNAGAYFLKTIFRSADRRTWRI